MATTHTSFQFKQFTVFQDRCGMKVGTDGVLLGAWAPVAGVRRVLDVGTGTGLIALQMAQRIPDASVSAIEIDEEATLQARENIACSPWSQRIEVLHCPLQQYRPTDRFQLIVSNPPYFDNALKCPDAARSLARHTDSLPFRELMEHAARLLEPHGKLCVVVPVQALDALTDAALYYKMAWVGCTQVFTKPGKPCKRLLLTFEAAADTTQCFALMAARTTDELYIHTVDNGYTDAYRALTAPFYLNL